MRSQTDASDERASVRFTQPLSHYSAFSKGSIINFCMYNLLSRHSTVANLPKTWVCEHLDNNVAKYLRKWLELPVSPTLSNSVLPYNKFGLNTQLFIQCKTVLRHALRTSSNKDIQALWKCTSSHSNVQYDRYRNTKVVLKAIKSDHEDRLKHHLISQGSFFSNVIEKSLSKVIPLWSTAQRHLSKSIFNFSIRYISNSLPNRTNLTKWGISPTSGCSFYLQPESLIQVVAGCKKYLEEGRCTLSFIFCQNHFQPSKSLLHTWIYQVLLALVL